MHITYVVVTVLAAAMVAGAAAADFRRPAWILANMTGYGIPHRWLGPLGAVKAAGALGLAAGLAVPPLGLAAAIGLTLYFIAAAGTVLHARAYSHLPFPLLFLAPVAASLALAGSCPPVA